MESANSHHHLQDQLVGSSVAPSSSSLATNYGVGFSTSHAWPPSSFLNSNWLGTEAKQQENPSVSSSSSSQLYNMAPDLGFNWGNNNNNGHNSSEHEHESRMIKEELAEHYYRKYYSEMQSSTATAATTEDEDLTLMQGNDVVATKFLLKSLSSYGRLPDQHLYPNNNSNSNIIRGGGGIFQDSSFNPTVVGTQGSLDMNLEALDLLASSRFSGNQIGIFRDGFIPSYSFDQMQLQPQQIPFYASNKVSSTSSNAITEAKRNNNNNKMEPKSQIQKAPKRSRLEARSSCPPLKVRKEKLGDRIAALQQLVAPFGKTDTASVLMEAIGYIKFLQNQVETLSVPYMKASRNKPNRIRKAVLGDNENENEESRRDLKSRGLCLVPLTCLSYITDGGGPAVWPPPHFGGAT